VRGGTHVEMIAGMIVDKISEEIKRKHKKLNVERRTIKQSLWIMYNATIENPTFSSQTKDTLTSHPRTFGF
jgi:DNA topoisomerase II